MVNISLVLPMIKKWFQKRSNWTFKQIEYSPHKKKTHIWFRLIQFERNYFIYSGTGVHTVYRSLRYFISEGTCCSPRVNSWYVSAENGTKRKARARRGGRENLAARADFHGGVSRRDAWFLVFQPIELGKRPAFNPRKIFPPTCLPTWMSSQED